MTFSIRDLLLVTLIVALAVGWWVDRSRLNMMLEKQGEEHRQTILNIQEDAQFQADQKIYDWLKKQPSYIGPDSLPASSAPSRKLLKNYRNYKN